VRDVCYDQGIESEQAMAGKQTIILGICGFSGSGKTRLIEDLLGVLRREGKRVGVVKHINEPVKSDTNEADTERFYRAGATVVGNAGKSLFIKEQEKTFSLEESLGHLGEGYDVILVEGFKTSHLAKLWLMREGETDVPTTVSNIVRVLGWSENRRAAAEKVLRAEMARQRGE
jgi:molybdopterin-guanine dinucleotide biosynthesis protein MobB